MPDSAVPPRAPLGDPFGGVLLRVGEVHVLALDPLPGADVIAQSVIVRYGVRLLEKPFISIVPGLLALERGEIMTGEAALDFILKRSNLYPRAEVFGYRSDGRDDMLTVKRLDLAIPPMVLAYADESAAQPLAEVAALIGPAEAFPARAIEYAPRFDDIEAYQHS